MRSLRNEIIHYRQENAKFLSFYFLLVHWLELRQDNISLLTYFRKKNYKSIAIYGMKELGERLFDELKGSEISVKYCIDKEAEHLYAEVDIYNPASDLEQVDAVIVTAINSFQDIRNELRKKMNCPIISLEDVVFEV